jgi:chromosome segregation ATPase
MNFFLLLPHLNFGVLIFENLSLQPPPPQLISAREKLENMAGDLDAATASVARLSAERADFADEVSALRAKSRDLAAENSHLAEGLRSATADADSRAKFFEKEISRAVSTAQEASSLREEVRLLAGELRLREAEGEGLKDDLVAAQAAAREATAALTNERSLREEIARTARERERELEASVSGLKIEIAREKERDAKERADEAARREGAWAQRLATAERARDAAISEAEGQLSAARIQIQILQGACAAATASAEADRRGRELSDEALRAARAERGEAVAEAKRVASELAGLNKQLLEALKEGETLRVVAAERQTLLASATRDLSRAQEGLRAAEEALAEMRGEVVLKERALVAAEGGLAAARAREERVRAEREGDRERARVERDELKQRVNESVSELSSATK